MSDIIYLMIPAHKHGVRMNYAVTWVGMLNPLALVLGIYCAIKRRKSALAWEKTHYTYQIKTGILFAAVGLPVCVLLAIAISNNSRDWADQLASDWAVVWGWHTLRVIRGWSLASSRKTIAFPNTLWVWPSAGSEATGGPDRLSS